MNDDQIIALENYLTDLIKRQFIDPPEWARY
jgi:hypothetical protein